MAKKLVPTKKWEKFWVRTRTTLMKTFRLKRGNIVDRIKKQLVQAPTFREVIQDNDFVDYPPVGEPEKRAEWKGNRSEYKEM